LEVAEIQTTTAKYACKLPEDKTPLTTESILALYGETFTYASNKLHGMKNVQVICIPSNAAGDSSSADIYCAA
jgi:hypothetical protein